MRIGGPSGPGIASTETMFAKPRPKKSILPPPSKKRKTTWAVEEVTFDNEARHEFLTGFHKRKQQRIKHAQEQAAKQARQEKLEARKQVRGAGPPPPSSALAQTPSARGARADRASSTSCGMSANEKSSSTSNLSTAY